MKPYNQYRALRPEYLELCDGNACAALILDLFAYWTQVRRDNDEQSRSGGGEGNDLWFHRSLTDISDDLYGAFGRAAIRTALQLLIDRGLVESRSNPAKPWDRTLQYRTLHGAKSNDVERSESNDDAGARPSQPLAAQAVNENCKEREKEPARKKAVKYQGKPVSPLVAENAQRLLVAFNEATGRNLSPFTGSGRQSDHLTRILGAFDLHPDATLDEWEQGIRLVVASPPSWVDGPVDIGDIFGPKSAGRTLGRVAEQRNGHRSGNGRVAEGQSVLSMLNASMREPIPCGADVIELPRRTA